MKVIKNTYPINLSHGDTVEWRLLRGTYYLFKPGASKASFAGPSVNRQGLKTNGKPPILIGVVAENKSKNQILELAT